MVVEFTVMEKGVVIARLWAEDAVLVLSSPRSYQVRVFGNQRRVFEDREAIAALPGRTGVINQRELEVLKLSAEGHTGTQIARWLHFSPSTIKRAKTGAIRKLGAATTIGAVRAAQRLGLLAPSRNGKRPHAGAVQGGRE